MLHKFSAEYASTLKWEKEQDAAKILPQNLFFLSLLFQDKKVPHSELFFKLALQQSAYGEIIKETWRIRDMKENY